MPASRRSGRFRAGCGSATASSATRCSRTPMAARTSTRRSRCSTGTWSNPIRRASARPECTSPTTRADRSTGPGRWATAAPGHTRGCWRRAPRPRRRRPAPKASRCPLRSGSPGRITAPTATAPSARASQARRRSVVPAARPAGSIRARSTRRACKASSASSRSSTGARCRTSPARTAASAGTWSIRPRGRSMIRNSCSRTCGSRWFRTSR